MNRLPVSSMRTEHARSLLRGHLSRVLASIVAALAASTVPPVAAQAPPRVVELAPSRQIRDDLAGSDVQVWRVVSVVGFQRDTLPGIEVLRSPSFVTDTMIRGFAIDSSNTERIRFEWRPGQEIVRLPMPVVQAGAIDLTRDGQALVYILDLHPSTEAQGVLEPWEGGPAVLTPRVPAFAETDATWYSVHPCPATSSYFAVVLWSRSISDWSAGFVRHAFMPDRTVHIDTLGSGSLPCDGVATADSAPVGPRQPAAATEVPPETPTPASPVPSLDPWIVWGLVGVFGGGGILLLVRRSTRGVGAGKATVGGPRRTRAEYLLLGGTLMVAAFFSVRAFQRDQALTTARGQNESARPTAGTPNSHSGAVPAESECSDAAGGFEHSVVIATSDPDLIVAQIGAAVWTAAQQCPSAQQVTVTTRVQGKDRYGASTTRDVDTHVYGNLPEVRRYRTAADYAKGPPDDHTVNIVAAGIKVQCAFGAVDQILCRD